MLEAFSRWLGKQSVARLLLVGVAAAALFGVGVLLADKSKSPPRMLGVLGGVAVVSFGLALVCLLYTSPSPRDATLSRMPSSA